MTRSGDPELERGRTAYDERAWDACCAALGAVAGRAPLEPDDLKLLSIAQYLSGDDEASSATMARGHKACLEQGRWRDAILFAFWNGYLLHGMGDHARGSGWVSRARTLAEEQGVEGAAAQLTVGQTLIQLGRSAEALPCLDEVMVAVADDELTPSVAGLAYCAVIATCMSLSDLRRAREWTAALSRWCESQTGLVPYRGLCLVHRTQIMTMEGSWPDALAEARSACEQLREPMVGEAWYRLGELHRLRGEVAEAEDAYRRANSLGRQPEPGLAQLRLTQGRVEAALATLRRLYDERERLDRSDIVFAYADAMVRHGDVGAAMAAAGELAETARAGDVPLEHARADEAKAAVLLAEDNVSAALPLLRRAWRGWQELGMPYDAARVRARIGDCLRAAGDEDSAQMEYDAARLVFEQLGARPALDGLLATAGRTRLPGGLTAREAEVLRLVAAGRTNKAVADELFLSEKTVARHLSNIYAKLAISSRSAATAYAYDHGLV